MERKKLIKTVLFVLFFLALGLANAYWNKNKVLSDPMFTVAMLTGKKRGGKGAYVEYEYIVNNERLVGAQSMSTVPKKTKIKAEKGKKYLLVYNKNKPKRSFLINIELGAELGADLTMQYSVDSLEEVGLISVLNF